MNPAQVLPGGFGMVDVSHLSGNNFARGKPLCAMASAMDEEMDVLVFFGACSSQRIIRRRRPRSPVISLMTHRCCLWASGGA